MSRLGRVLERRAITPQDVPWWNSISAETQSNAGVQVTTDTAFRLADVYACVRVIADACATIPLYHYRDANGGRERVPITPGRATGVLENPAPGMSQANLMAATATHLNLSGEAFWVKFRADGGRGKVEQLAILKPQRVTNIATVGGEPVYTVQPGDGSKLQGKFTRSDILHIRGLSLDGMRGVSPIGQTANGIGVGIALEDAAGRDFANGAYPGAVITAKGVVSPEAQKRFRKAWNSMFRGSQNRGKVAILEEDWTYQPIGMPARDAQFVEQRKLSATQIARIFRVPPYMIGADAGGSMTYSTVEAELTSFATHTIRPWLTFIEQAIKSDDDLRGDAPGDYPEFNLDEFLRADMAVRFLAYQQADWLSTNDKRRREGEKAVEGGDLVPAIERLKTAAIAAQPQEVNP